ncbi:MAG: PQQ-binding-like beta-propeller repeat protein [Planctomycetaceae bacterium]|nr:PQQ-binding-like beta-propeller repeat protein [Planctomycetaceae bacterium]
MKQSPYTMCWGSVLVALTFGICLHSNTNAGASDWRQFRGNLSNSVAADANLPTELSGGTVAWKKPLPGRGLSGPIVVGGRLYLTASSGYAQDRLHVLCFDAETGEQIWERQFTATGRTGCHDKMCNATPTMASDGTRVFAFFSSNDLICLDLDGNLQWYRGLGSEFPNASNSLGMSSSPIVIGTSVVVQVESDAEAFACGIDAESGQTKWQIERPRAANWTSPTVLPATESHPGLALLQSSKGVAAVDPETGETVWNFDKGASTIPSSTVSEGRVIIPSNGLTILQPSEDGKSFEQLLNESSLSPSTPSPVVVNGISYTINSAGVVSAGDLKDGKRIWQLRLKGPFSGTPIVSNGYLYVFNEGGTAFVVKLGSDKGESISELDLGETVLCSPAASGNSLYVRSDGHLWKFADPQ